MSRKFRSATEYETKDLAFVDLIHCIVISSIFLKNGQKCARSREEKRGMTLKALRNEVTIS